MHVEDDASRRKSVSTRYDPECRKETAVSLLAAEIRRLMLGHHFTLTQAGIRKEMRTLENWLESEGRGPAPAGVITQGGLNWLSALRDELKRKAGELRAERQGGVPLSIHQLRRSKDLLTTIRRIDKIIAESTIVHPH